MPCLLKVPIAPIGINLAGCAEELTYSITSIDPPQGGHGRVTTTLDGAAFREATEAFLVGSTGARYEADKVHFVSPTELSVRRQLDSVPLGTYDVAVRTDAGETTLPQAFTVVEAPPPTVTAAAPIPEAVRAGGKGGACLHVYEYGQCGRRHPRRADSAHEYRAAGHRNVEGSLHTGAALWSGA